MNAPQPTQSPLAAAMGLIRDRTGLAPLPSVRKGFETSIRKAMTAAGLVDADEFAQRLDTDSQLFDALIADLTVGETYFFREPAHFEVLRSDVVPDLMQGRADRPLRAWSAGCATGEEAYSLAIFFEQEGLSQRSSVLGTDISRTALQRARNAVYGGWSLRNSAPDFAAQYFHRKGEQLQLLDRLRKRVDFAYLNLAAGTYPSPTQGTCGVDVIMCRNVLIYFEQDTVAAIANRLFASLAHGGWLLTGPSDPPLWTHAPFETMLTSAGVFYRRPSKSVVPWVRPPAAATAMPPAELELVRAVPAFVEPIPVIEPPIVDRDIAARVAFDAGDFRRVLVVTQLCERDPGLCALRVRALANIGASHAAEAEAAAAIDMHPLNAELHYLRAVILVGMGRHDAAEEMLRRVIYLDRSLAVAHFTLSSLLRRRGDADQAARGYRTVVALCSKCRGDEIAPLSDGELTVRLAAAARAQLAAIQETTGGTP